IWQREWLRDEVLAKELEYWSEQLKDLPPLELPLDRKRLEQRGNRAGVKRFALTEEQREKLRQLSRANSVTLYMTLLAAFNIVLWRYTAQDDLAVGTVIANRNRKETEGLIGFFVNTLVLRTRMDGKLTFQQLLQRVRKVALEAYAHQD